MPDDDIKLVNEITAESVERVLAGPEHESLGEAIAADAVDLAPVIGDVLALKRKQRAEEQGVTMPDKPAYIENVLSDLPPPLATLGDAAVSQNVIRYVNENSKASPFLAVDEKTGELVARLPPQDD